MAAWYTSHYTAYTHAMLLTAPFNDNLTVFPPTRESHRHVCARIWQAVIQNRWKAAADTFNRLPNVARAVLKPPVAAALDAYKHFMLLPDATRIALKLAAVNSALWVVFRRRGYALAKTVHNPMVKETTTLFTNWLVHRDVRHLIASNAALVAFAQPTADWMVNAQDRAASGLYEATPKYHFLSFIISASLFSCAVSTVALRTFGYRQLVSALAVPSRSPHTATPFTRLADFMLPRPPFTQLSSTPAPITFGASGIAYALAAVAALGVQGTSAPAFALQLGVGGALLMDIVGAFFGWRRFDHWAQISGAAFGAVYYGWGMQLWDYCRRLTWEEKFYQDLIARGTAVLAEMRAKEEKKVREKRRGTWRKGRGRPERKVSCFFVAFSLCLLSCFALFDLYRQPPVIAIDIPPAYDHRYIHLHDQSRAALIYIGIGLSITLLLSATHVSRAARAPLPTTIMASCAQPYYCSAPHAFLIFLIRNAYDYVSLKSRQGRLNCRVPGDYLTRLRQHEAAHGKGRRHPMDLDRIESTTYAVRDQERHPARAGPQMSTCPTPQQHIPSGLYRFTDAF
ncbi:hypothetical protein FA95DRAFT_1004928 [Auriscalpium vulgare]|uniref:Uncharacterized protein n=1 Tax=Auriscalpium vulgare TaxID=40419 RepID=A0ACB8RYU6_9AGAM|nr:hypothetical protein FA95DRAFT_1004928 [Auriscalpium vulgare]